MIDAVGDAGRLVGHLVHRHAFDHILEFDDAVDFGQDRPRIRIPFGQARAALHLVAIVDEQPRAVDHLVNGALIALGVFDDDGRVAAHDHRDGPASPSRRSCCGS